MRRQVRWSSMESRDLVIGHPHSLFVGLARRRANNTNVIVTILRADRGGLHILGVTTLAPFIDLIADNGARERARTRTDQSAFTGMAGLITDNCARARAKESADYGAVLRGGRVTACGEGCRGKQAE